MKKTLKWAGLSSADGPVLPIAPAVGLFTPTAEQIDHSASHPVDPVPGTTKEYGEYLKSPA